MGFLRENGYKGCPEKEDITESFMGKITLTLASRVRDLSALERVEGRL